LFQKPAQWFESGVFDAWVLLIDNNDYTLVLEVGKGNVPTEA
jgi:hypothetical protein